LISFCPSVFELIWRIVYLLNSLAGGELVLLVIILLHHWALFIEVVVPWAGLDLFLLLEPLSGWYRVFGSISVSLNFTDIIIIISWSWLLIGIE